MPSPQSRPTDQSPTKIKKSSTSPRNGSARLSANAEAEAQPSGGCRVDLKSEEVELVLKACEKYRWTLPSYLQSVQHELELVDEVLEKLRATSSSR